MTFTMDTTDQEAMLTITLIQQFTVMMCFFNQALNFYLYCLTGSRFRSELVEMFRSCCGRAALANGPGPIEAKTPR